MLSRRRIMLLSALVVFSGVVGATAGAAVFLVSGGGRILPGVSVGELPIGGFTRAQARSALSRYDREVVQRTVLLSLGDRTIAVSPREVGFALDVDATVHRASTVGRTGSWTERVRTLRRLWSTGVRIDPALRGGQTALKPLLVRLAAELRQPARNARFDPKTGRFAPEAPGHEVLFAESLRRLSAAFFSAESRRVTLAVRRVPPQVTLEQLRRAGIQTVLATFTTRFDPADQNRVHNIRLAAEALDGILIRPGEVLSFNGVTGDHTEARGYRPAYEIVREKFVLGIGGGVCQVSSTLYNAALLAGLQIPGRTPHSQPLGYVPPGRDATVYDGLIDLKIRNNRSHSVVVSSAVGSDSLTIAFSGRWEDFPEVRLELSPLEPVEPGPDVIEVDPGLAPGVKTVVEESRLGYRVKLYRRYYRNGEQVAVELVSQDFYPPRPRRLKVGPPAPQAAERPTGLPLPGSGQR